MTQYLLSVHATEADRAVQASRSPEAIPRINDQVDQFNKNLKDIGAYVFAGGLEPFNSAKMVRADSAATSVTDHPYGDARVHLSGFWIIEAPSLDAALALAAAGSRACEGAVEVRAFQPT